MQVSYSVEQPLGGATRRWLGERCMLVLHSPWARTRGVKFTPEIHFLLLCAMPTVRRPLNHRIPIGPPCQFGQEWEGLPRHFLISG